MPFLAPLIPAIAGGAASAAVGAGVNAISKAASGGNDPRLNANIQAPVGSDQAQNAINGSNSALGQQEQLVKALQSQGAITNQSNVYNQQQALAGQLGLMAAGQGPNPAQAQLAQNTGNNIAGQAALMAGQRGAGANAGLIARQAAQQGGNMQQQATGQAATLQAQQQLGAIGALQQQQGMLGNLATTQVGQQLGATQAQTAAQQAQQAQLLNQVNAQNQAGLGASGQAQGQQQFQQQQLGRTIGGVASGVGPAVQSMFAQGGAVLQQGGPEVALKENYKGKSKIGSLLMAKGGSVNMKTGGHVPGKAKVAGAKDSYANDTVPALLSPGEIVLPRSVTQSSDPVEGAKKFVEAIKSKKGKK